jgi:hypothetical protein
VALGTAGGKAARQLGVFKQMIDQVFLEIFWEYDGQAAVDILHTFLSFQLKQKR